MPTPCDPAQGMLLKVMRGGRGGHYPLGHLRRGGGGSLSPGSILPLRGTGDAASGLLAEKRHHRRCREPGDFAARVLVGRRPGSWIAERMDRRLVRELSLLLVTRPPFPKYTPPISTRSITCRSNC